MALTLQRWLSLTFTSHWVFCFCVFRLSEWRVPPVLPPLIAMRWVIKNIYFKRRKKNESIFFGNFCCCFSLCPIACVQKTKKTHVVFKHVAYLQRAVQNQVNFVHVLKNFVFWSLCGQSISWVGFVDTRVVMVTVSAFVNSLQYDILTSQQPYLVQWDWQKLTYFSVAFVFRWWLISRHGNENLNLWNLWS